MEHTLKITADEDVILVGPAGEAKIGVIRAVQCPKGDQCALNHGAVKCKACERNWPPDATWRYEMLVTEQTFGRPVVPIYFGDTLRIEDERE